MEAEVPSIASETKWAEAKPSPKVTSLVEKATFCRKPSVWEKRVLKKMLALEGEREKVQPSTGERSSLWIILKGLMRPFAP